MMDLYRKAVLQPEKVRELPKLQHLLLSPAQIRQINTEAADKRLNSTFQHFADKLCDFMDNIYEGDFLGYNLDMKEWRERVRDEIS